MLQREQIFVYNQPDMGFDYESHGGEVMTRTTSLMTIGLVFALTLLSVSAHAQNLLVNGNFSTGSLAPWVPFTTSNGTNGSGLPAVVKLSNSSGSIYAAHFDVGEVNYDSSEQGGGLSQVFSVSSTGTYDYSMQFAARDDQNGGVNADAGTFSVIIDGVTLATKALGGFSSAYQVLKSSLSGSVSLTAGSHTFEVQITRMYISSGTDTPDQIVTGIALKAAANGVHRK